MVLNLHEKWERRKKMFAFSDVVLLKSKSAQVIRLKDKLAERIDKEFKGVSLREMAVTDAIKKKNLQFGESLVKQHNNGEFFVQIQENVRKKDVHLFHQFQDPNLDLVELCITADALLRADVNSVSLYAPYIPYQRQDKKDDGRVPISAKLVFKLLEASFGSSLKRIVTFDLHARQAEAHFDGPLSSFSAVPEFAAYYRHKFRGECNEENVVVISPDAGGAKRACYLAELLGIRYYVLDKRRTGHGEAETTFYLDLDVKGKKAIIIDDMIDSGGSLVGKFEEKKIGPVQYLQEREAEVYICATHAILSEKDGISAEERFRKAGAPVLFTSSLPERYPGYYKDNQDWMEVISLNYALAKAFYCNQVGESISDFLKKREAKLKGEHLDFVIRKNAFGVVDVEGVE